MKRTQIQLDDTTYEAVRRRAFEQGRSMAAVVREALSEAFGAPARAPLRTIDDFTFVGMGTDPDPPADLPVSVDHDRWYAEAVASRWEGPMSRRGRDIRGHVGRPGPGQPPRPAA